MIAVYNFISVFRLGGRTKHLITGAPFNFVSPHCPMLILTDVVKSVFSKERQRFEQIWTHWECFHIEGSNMLLHLAILSGDLCKSGPGHFASEKSLGSNFTQ